MTRAALWKVVSPGLRSVPPHLLGLGGILVCALLISCTTGEVERSDDAASGAEVDPTASSAYRVSAMLGDVMSRIEARAAAIDSIFQPLPLLAPSEEETLRSYSNAAQLGRARALGVGRELSRDRITILEQEGALVRLTENEYWIVRDLDHSQPLAVPAVRDLLDEIGRRFQRRLAALGAPPYRLEVSSVLRTAADQDALRQINPNAALGESSHEYGTTVDVLYSAYAAPTAPIVDIEADLGGGEAGGIEPYLRRYAAIAAERVAGRRALELKALLGYVLIEMQREGWVMVTLERQQPVFHMTIMDEGR